ncbi:hypothetical protein [Nocardia terpenica]|uniref:hypothetical protein n=1 Tax=Nocardia terpenica TaxID=455432 RepID=UPI00158202F6|nr:hypothetical protein [Nocardia terpenica]
MRYGHAGVLGHRPVAALVAVVLVTVTAGPIGVARPATAAPAPPGIPAAQDVPIRPLPAAVLPPEVDPFYKAPADVITSTPPGGIIKARRITPALLSVLPFNSASPSAESPPPT